MATTSDTDTDQGPHEPPSTSTNGTSRSETRPITIMLPDDLLKKLKIVAIVKETSVSELITEAATTVVRKELKKALARIAGE